MDYLVGVLAGMCKAAKDSSIQIDMEVSHPSVSGMPDYMLRDGKIDMIVKYIDDKYCIILGSVDNQLLCSIELTDDRFLISIDEKK